MMKPLRIRAICSLFFGALIGGALIISMHYAGALVTQSYHKNTMWTAAQVSSAWGWHGYEYNEEALDLMDPDCISSGNCNTVYFRYQGLNQYSAEYTVTDYSITVTCTGRYYTVNYYSGGQWHPLIRLAFVHLKSLRPLSNGVYYSLGYSQELNEWVGAVDETQPASCAWVVGSPPTAHVHYARSTNFGVNAKNGAAGFGSAGSWVGSDEVTFVAYAP